MSEHMGVTGDETTPLDERRAGRHRAPQHRAEADLVADTVVTDAVVTPLRGRHRGAPAPVDPAAPAGGRHCAPHVYDEPAPVIALSKARQHEAYRQAE